MVESASHRWQFWIDRGGTFTDVVARRPDGSIVTHKLLSENPERYADAALAGIREILGVKGNQPVPSELIEAVKMGTTVATNALLERKGERTVLFITRGFRDALRIAYQNRPRLFDRHIVLPEMLYSGVFEVEERIGAGGEVVLPFDVLQTRKDLEKAYGEGFRSIAIVFMHGYRFPEHERQVAELARQVGFTQISASHRVSPLMKLVGRGDTTVVDAYLSPILRRYVEQVAAELEGVRLLFMQSNGGLTDARRFQGKDAILSGPAGGLGRAGPLTVTDANLMLGKIQPKYFPQVFGADGSQELDEAVVKQKFSVLVKQIGDNRSPEQVAEGFIQIAVGNMANAIKHISVQRGHDVTGYTLCCFGGAAGQHACLVADALAMTRVFIHPYAGVLSAYGMGLADQTAMREQALELKLQGEAALEDAAEKLAIDARDSLIAQGVSPERVRVMRRAHLKYEGTDTALMVALGPMADMVNEFEAAYRKQFSFLMPGKPLIVEAVSVEA